MKIKFYEGNNLKWSKSFLLEENADRFIAIMEKITKPSITIKPELYLNQRIPMHTISDIATENVFVKKLEEGFKKGLTADMMLEQGIPSSVYMVNEELVVQTSLDTAIREYMVDLFSRIVCARDYAHLLHLNADSGGQHLMLEKIYEALDDMVDDCGEKYFMARNIKIPNPLVKNEIYAAGDLGDLLAEMSTLCENICKDPNLDEAIKSMVSGFGEDFQRCMGFWRQAQMDNPNKLTESVYIKRVKDGANKYFCNLNGSPAWGPKDLAIQFKDEVEAKKFLKKYDYLLSKNKITIVNESVKLKKKLTESWWINDPDDEKPEGWKEALAEMQKYEEQSEEWYSDGNHPAIYRNLPDTDYEICVGFKDVEDYYGKNRHPEDKPWSVQEINTNGDNLLKVKFFSTFPEAISFANSLLPQELKPFDKFLQELKEKYGSGYIAQDVWGYTHVYKNKPYYNQTIDGYYEDGSDYYRPGYWEGDKLDNKDYEYELNNAYKLQYGKSVPRGSKAIWSF